MTESAIEPKTPVADAADDASLRADLEARLAAAEARAAEARDRELRALAELDNGRKRAQREIEQAQRFALERLVAELVPVIDSLELALAAAGGSEAVKLAEGVRMTLRLLGQTLERFGVTAEDPAGRQFDPELHEAMTTQPSAEHPDGTVLSVVQKGYLLNGRLIRPARVVVSRTADPVETPVRAPN